MSEMITREFQARLVENEERTIVGLAVPYGQEIELTGKLKERFEPGAIDGVENVKLFYGHEEPIGKVIEGRDTEAGYEIVAKISDTPRGNEVYTLLQDDVLNRFSVGFFPVVDRQEGQTIVRELVDLKEVSVVPFPAFEGAKITQVRSEAESEETESADETIIETESETMSENIELDVRSVQDEVAELRRVIESGKAVEIATPAAHKFRSQGEFVKAMVDGDEDAKALARAASTSADSVQYPPFFGYIDTLIRSNRPTLEAFSRAALPEAGLTVEYAQIDTNTLDVDAQSPENTALAFGNLTFETNSTPIATFGGYTSVSRQYIERSNISMVNTVFEALTQQYAKATNAALVSALAALNYAGKTFTADGGTAASLATGIANGASYIFQQTGLRPTFILAAPDAYVSMVTVAGTDGRPVVSVSGNGVNNVGVANIPGLSGSVFGLPVIVDPALAAGTVYMANPAAAVTMESAGSPVRLSAGDITTLTDDLSVYGYLAIAVPRFGALVKLDVID
jgi:HK97 family phage prohead protease